MKVLLKQEWNVKDTTRNGLLVVEHLFRNECLLIDILKLYDKERNKSFVYRSLGTKVEVLEWPKYLSRIKKAK